MQFSRDLLIARTNSRWSQQYVADQVGISIREYQNIESGKRYPHVITFLGLIYLFDMDIQVYRKEVMHHVLLRLG